MSAEETVRTHEALVVRGVASGPSRATLEWSTRTGREESMTTPVMDRSEATHRRPCASEVIMLSVTPVRVKQGERRRNTKSVQHARVERFAPHLRHARTWTHTYTTRHAHPHEPKHTHTLNSEPPQLSRVCQPSRVRSSAQSVSDLHGLHSLHSCSTVIARSATRSSGLLLGWPSIQDRSRVLA